MHLTEWMTYYIEFMGFSLLPVKADKRPQGEWERYQARRPARADRESWGSHGIGIVTGAISGIVVVDCESLNDTLWFMRTMGTTPAIVETRRGFHLYFLHPGKPVKNAQRIRDEAGISRYDVRGDGGYVVAPPTEHAEGRYFWFEDPPPKRFWPVFNPDWRPEIPAPVVAPTVRPTAPSPRTGGTFPRIKDAERYIQKIRAVSGKGGHDATWMVVNRLKDAGYSSGEAWNIMVAWNQTNAEPPWSVRELAHKVRSCFGDSPV